MQKTRIAAAVSTFAMALGLGACATTKTQTVVDTPNGPAVTTTRSITPAWSTTPVTVAPPALQTETQGTAPYADAVWIPGYYTYANGTYSWVAGRWDRARTGYTWVPAAWEQRADGWYFREGYWSN